MGAYFTQKRHIDDLWASTILHMPANTTPYYRVLSGGRNKRFIFGSATQTLYWGCLAHDYYGSWVLHNPDRLPVSEMPIAPIRSYDMEAFKHEVLAPDNESDFYEYWANYFAKSLLDNDKHFLSAGEWRIEKSAPYGQDKLGYPPKGMHHSLAYYAELYSSKEVLQYVEIDFNSALPIVYFDRLDEHDGRVKWWRKKAREGICPPIFTWFKDNLQAHYVIDGHARLLACLLEDVTPKVLTISQILTENYAIDNAEREKLQSIIDKNQHRMPTDVLNTMLINRHSAFRTFERSATYATAIKGMDERWLQDVHAQVEQYPVDAEELQCMIDGL